MAILENSLRSELLLLNFELFSKNTKRKEKIILKTAHAEILFEGRQVESNSATGRDYGLRNSLPEIPTRGNIQDQVPSQKVISK